MHKHPTTIRNRRNRQEYKARTKFDYMSHARRKAVYNLSDEARGAWFEQNWLEATGAWDILDERERDEYRHVCGARDYKEEW